MEEGIAHTHLCSLPPSCGEQLDHLIAASILPPTNNYTTHVLNVNPKHSHFFLVVTSVMPSLINLQGPLLQQTPKKGSQHKRLQGAYFLGDASRWLSRLSLGRPLEEHRTEH